MKKIKLLIVLCFFLLSSQIFSEVIYKKNIVFDSMNDYSVDIKIEKNVTNIIRFQTLLYLSPQTAKEQITTKIIYNSDGTIDFEGWNSRKIDMKPQYRYLNITNNKYNPIIRKVFSKEKWKEIYTLSIIIANLIYTNNDMEELKIKN